MSRRYVLPRRTFLRGAGALIGLPFLEAMVPARADAQASGAPLRFMGLFHPNGVNRDAWTPTATGAGYSLSPTLEPLLPVKDALLVLTGLNLAPDGRGVGSHEGGQRALLTASDEIVGGTTSSVDQVIAEKTKAVTRVASLQLGLENNAYYDPGFKDANNDGFFDFGNGFDDARDYCGDTDHCHAAIANGTRLPNFYNPRVVFDRLFGAGPLPTTGDASAANAAKLNRYRRSVLDLVASDTKRLQQRLGALDKLRMDEYLTGIREIEASITRLENQASGGGGGACLQGTRPVGIPADRTAFARLMFDMAAKAFECDLTRSATFMFGQGVSPMNFTIEGATYSHHADASHHGGNPAKLRAKHLIDRWHIEQLAYFLTKLKSIPEAGGTVLDNSVVFYSSDLSDGDLHNHDNMPVLVAGKAGGRIRSGRHLRVAGTTGDLFISILQAFDIQRTTFGKFGTKPLSLS